MMKGMQRFWLSLCVCLGMVSGISNPVGSTLPVHAIVLIGGAPYYSPVKATVSSGQPVEWINRTASPHTITHAGCFTAGEMCAFDSGALAPGARFSVYYLPPGTYPYRCRLHPIMEGMLIVREAVRVADVSSHQQ